MKLLLLNHNLREHGTFFRAFHFGRELARLGHDVTLLTASPNHWYRPVTDRLDGMEIIETPSWNPFFNRDDGYGPLDVLYRAGLMVHRRWDALYVFAHPPNVLVPQWLWRWAGRGPVAVDWCDLYGGKRGIVARRRQLWTDRPETRPASAFARAASRLSWRIEQCAERHTVRRAPKLSVISRFLYRAARRWGVPGERIRHIPSGAPTDSIRPLPKEQCRGRLGLSSSPGRIHLVYVANYHPDEDFFLDTLARAMRERAREGKEENARVHVVGPAFSRGAVERRGLARYINEVGRRPFAEMNDWLGAADLLLLPYPTNTFNRSRWPNKIGDYLAAGRPILTNRTGDFTALFEGERIGLASDSTPEAYARAIAGAMREPDRWEAWGTAARAMAEGPLHWGRLARELSAFWLGEEAL
jgi:glycosyltransferase involved in cell wall biosynthesis